MSYEVARLSVDEVLKLAKDETALYVVNNTNWRVDGETGKVVKQPLGVVHIPYKNEANEQMAIQIPNTWVPINVAEFCNVALIVKSSFFVEWLRKDLLVVISASDAKKILSTAEAQQAIAEHNVRAQAGPVGSNGRISSGANARFTVGPGRLDADAMGDMGEDINSDALAELLTEFNENKISDAVAVDRFNAMNLSVDDITSNMENMQDNSSQLGEAMMARIEALESKGTTASTRFQ